MMFKPRFRHFLQISLCAVALSAASSHAENLKVGFITSLSGPVSSMGTLVAKGLQAGTAYQGELSGRKVNVITLDDASDPSIAARNARKLISEENVDIIIGTTGSPGSLAIAAVAREAGTPQISIANANLDGEAGAWMVTMPQPAPLMVNAVVEDMVRNNVKTVGYIGFSDPWGDLVYDALKASAEPHGIKVLTNERFARADTSIVGQVLKTISARPDAVMTGTSGTPGALPYITLAERGYKGRIYGTHGIVGPEFIQVGKSAVEGLLAPTGPIIVAEQLPDDDPMKKVALDYRAAYEKTHGTPPMDAFSAYAFDGWLLALDAAKRAESKGFKPGTPEFRLALRDAITSTKELVGTHSIYNFKPESRYGSDERSRVIVQLQNGQWQLVGR